MTNKTKILIGISVVFVFLITGFLRIKDVGAIPSVSGGKNVLNYYWDTDLNRFIAGGEAFAGGPSTANGEIILNYCWDSTVNRWRACLDPAVSTSTNFWTQVGNDIYYNTGKVGIGTTTPAYELDVVGKIYASENFRFDDSVGGISVGTSSSLPLTEVTVMGYEAGKDNTDIRITAFGYQAGYEQEGTHSTYFGRGAGSGNTKGRAAAFGWGALTNNAGFQSTGVGFNAGWSNTGAGLSSVGSGAGQSNTGSNVTAIGYGAAKDNTGDQVTAIGRISGVGNTGDYGVFIGNRAGYDNTEDFIFEVSMDDPTIVGTPIYTLLRGDFKNGLLGVNTTTPAYALDVVGDINATGTYRINGTDYGQFFIDSTGTDGELWKSDGIGRGTWVNTSTLGFISTETDPIWTAVSTTVAYLAKDNQFTGENDFNTTTTFPSGIWGSDSKVGIGTSTPDAMLHISDTTDNLLTLQSDTSVDLMQFKNVAGTVIGGVGLEGNSMGLSVGYDGTGEAYKITNVGGVTRFAQGSFYPDTLTSNVAMAFQIIPKGTGFGAIKSQLSMFNTDIVADNVNYQLLLIKADGTEQLIDSTSNGTYSSIPVRIGVDLGSNANSGITVKKLSTFNLVGINTNNPAYFLDVNGGMRANGYYSNDGTIGWTGTCGSASSTVYKNGLVTACN